MAQKKSLFSTASTSTAPSPAAGMVIDQSSSRRGRHLKPSTWGYIFISPWILGFLLFSGGPLVASLFLSLTEYDILSSPRFLGVDNYTYALTEDPLFWNSIWRTTYFAVVAVPLGLVGSLVLAILLNQGLRATNLFRTLFFLPHLTPAVAMAILWTWLLHPTLGFANTFLGQFGIGNYAWLTSKETVIPTMIMISLWAGVGGNTMLIFLAALQGIPRDLEEAAELDGAGSWNKFRAITLPLISPVILFNLILGIISSFQVFTLAFVATDGGPSYGSYFFILHIYNQAFDYFRLGYGAALAWIFLLIVLALTLVNFSLSRRWVYYQGDA